MSFQNEQIVESKTCPQCGVSFDITHKDLEFYEKVSPTFGGKKYALPSPTLCPECRQQRRLVWRNERKLYKRKCDATGKDMISMYSPDKPYTVYEEAFWWSDKWDGRDYGREFDMQRSVFDQIGDLVLKVPHKSLINNFETNENANFANFSGNNKDSYWVFEAGSLEQCYYSNNIRRSYRCVDNLGLIYGDNCYQTVDCNNVNTLSFSQDCKDCHQSSFLIDCRNCEHCFMCFGLRDKKYCIENKSYSQQEYEKKKQQLIDAHPDLSSYFQNFISTRIVPAFHGFGNQNCSGDYLYNSVNARHCFDSKNLEDAKYCSVMSSSKDISRDCYDYDYFGYSEKSCEIVTVGQNAYNVLFTVNTWDNVSRVYYCINCKGSSDCFACFGLNSKQYCILNKQYSKEEYEKLVPKIIERMREDGEWGEFFPASMSPFGYNETVANEYYPLNKGEALDQGLNWSDYEAPFPKVDKVIPASKLPDNIKDIPDDILNWAIECEVTKKPFRIIPQELELYRKHSLPIPRRHPDQRHLDRMSLRNPRKLFTRNCDKCGIEIQTTYAPDRPEKVYCEACYNKEIY